MPRRSLRARRSRFTTSNLAAWVPYMHVEVQVDQVGNVSNESVSCLCVLRLFDPSESSAALLRKDAQGRVSGGPDLASSAAYPAAFCTKLFHLWLPCFQKVLKEMREESASSTQCPRLSDAGDRDTANA